MKNIEYKGYMIKDNGIEYIVWYNENGIELYDTFLVLEDAKEFIDNLKIS
jgi:hypothetical protein